MPKLATDLTLDGVGARLGGGVRTRTLGVVVGGSPVVAVVVVATRGVAVFPSARLSSVARVSSTATAAATGGNVGGGLEATAVALVERHPLIKIAHLSKELIERDRGGAGVKC